jgi:hypothetical protein
MIFFRVPATYHHTLGNGTSDDSSRYASNPASGAAY